MNKEFLKLEQELCQHFQERHEVIRGLLVAAIAKGNMLILGPPGTAKTALAETLSHQLGGRFFSRLLTKVSAPEELFGPLSLKALENDMYKRVTAGKLPEAEIAVIDEVFKCNSAVLNTLLPILNERVYFDEGSLAKPIPLQVLVGLSNELPDGGVDGELAALWDRFDLRYTVSYIKDEMSFTGMLTTATNGIMTTIPMKVLNAAQQQAAAIPITAITLQALVHLWKELRNQGFVISDRRFRNSLRFLKAHAWLEGRSEVGEDDLAILSAMFWSDPQEKKAIRKIVLGFANPLALKANEIYDSVAELQAKLADMPDGADRTALATEANHKLKVALKALDALRKQATQEGKNTTTIQERINQVKVANELVVNQYLLGM